MGLFEQQQLGVAGNPAAEVDCPSRESTRDCCIERHYLHGVGSTNARTESRHRRAHHIHPGIPLSHHRQRRDGMYRRRAVIRVAHHVGHPGPQLSHRTEFSDRHELIVIGRESEADLVQRVHSGHPGRSQQP